MSKDLFSIKLSKKSEFLMKELSFHADHVSVENSMDLIGRQYRQEVRLIFKRKQVRQPSLKWPDLKKRTLADKEKEGYGHKGILERTGNLRRSMTGKAHPNNITKIGSVSAEFGSSVEYGNFHDDTESPREKLPLRNFTIPSDTTYGVFLRIIDEDLKAQLKLIGVTTT